MEGPDAPVANPTRWPDLFAGNEGQGNRRSSVGRRSLSALTVHPPGFAIALGPNCHTAHSGPGRDPGSEEKTPPGLWPGLDARLAAVGQLSDAMLVTVAAAQTLLRKPMARCSTLCLPGSGFGPETGCTLGQPGPGYGPGGDRLPGP
jgi:hypothetical protein